MKVLATNPVFHSALAAALQGVRGSHLNEFRRRRIRLASLSAALGIPMTGRVTAWAVAASQLLTVAVILFGLAWIPARSGLRSFGIPVEAPTIAAALGVLLALGLLKARRRYSSTRTSWIGVSGGMDVGMRAGAVSLDIGLALMLLVQNLRWHEPENLLAAGALVLSTMVVAWPVRGHFVSVSSAASIVLILACLATVVATGHRAAGLFQDQTTTLLQAGAVVCAALLAGGGSVLAYRWCAPADSLRSRGLYLDLGLRASLLVVLPAAVMVVVDLTLWRDATPYVGLAAFFLLLLFFRAALARVLSPEGLGYGLFLLRLTPETIRPVVLRSIALALMVLLVPVVLFAAILLIRSGPVVVILLFALVVLEICTDAFIIQRSTAVLPARSISKLAQKSKAGLGAAVCAAVAITFSGVLGAAGPQVVGTTSLLVAAGALMVVAMVLAGLTVYDAPTWIKDLAATETEEP